jgi:hypothetical protein
MTTALPSETWAPLFALLDAETTNVEPTFLDVAGVPRRELSLSSVLRFLLDADPASAPHGLGSTFATGLIRAGTGDPDAEASPTVVSREVGTRGGKSIDLVVVEADRITKVELKIDASLSNPLGEYDEHWSDDWPARDDVMPFNLVVGPASWRRRHPERLGHGFTFVALDDWARNVRSLLGAVARSANPRYWWMALDALDAMESYDRSIDMDTQLISEFADVQDEANAFLQKVREANRALDRVVARVQEAASDTALGHLEWRRYSMGVSWVGAKAYAVCIVDDGQELEVALVAQPTGWGLELFPKGDTTRSDLEALANRVSPHETWSWVGAKSDIRKRDLGPLFDTDPADVAAKLNLLQVLDPQRP